VSDKVHLLRCGTRILRVVFTGGTPVPPTYS